ncbi:hypothetical protein [Schleiferilactobacillus harbinensis]|jgi:hypothetical protein|uniref:hypothetical protein n=1 Tax=Schleiferilactobacillus harbinensis TaxID=304207 RepID=UPI000E9F3216|nr:hypothetical protein [Schleiferilactobacillus harbinensis]MCI1686894.1 hypothetical protein [Schleiferilactobacillus harbinensis]MCI1784254.1 hypothetical protein [Schleiferilactobacillus harbinensis]MCI1850565.1 hypothetical protein [Schleiferilactobacillus harbinensis]HAY52960.1 hypothetical protein [Lactobacillus sp.]
MFWVKKYLHSDRNINILGVIILLSCVGFALSLPKIAPPHIYEGDVVAAAAFVQDTILRFVAFALVWLIGAVIGLYLTLYQSKSV